MIYICQGVLIVFLGVIAEHQAKLIQQQKKIYHGWWALVYAVPVVVFAYFLKSFLFLGLGVLIRALFFDLFLNYARFGWWGMSYRSPTTTSIWDKLTYKLPFWPMKVVWLIGIIVLNFFV